MGLHSGAVFTIIFWFRVIYALILVGVPLLIVGASVCIATRRSRRGRPGAAIPPARTRQARWARIGGLFLGAVAGVAGSFFELALIAPAMVAAGYLLGVLVGELASWPRPTGQVRVASLQARDARRYLPRWVIPATLCTGLLAAAGAIALAVASWFLAGMGWPPAMLSVLLALFAATGLVAGAVLLPRVAALPQPGGPDAGHGADQVRLNTARAIAGAVLGIEMLTLGAIAIQASGALAFRFTEASYLISRVLVWTGLVLVVAGLVTWPALGWWRRGPAEPPASSPAASAAA
jgi:hypothetical protein